MKFLMQEIKLTEKELKELQNVISMLENIIIFMEKKGTKELVINRETIKGTIFSIDKICNTQSILQTILFAKTVYTGLKEK